MTREAFALEQTILTKGPAVMSDTDLLGIVMRSPYLARAVANHSLGLRDVDRANLSQIPRFSASRTAQVIAIIELAGRIASKPLESGQAIHCSADVTGVYRPRLSSRKQECFYVLALDTKNRIISEHEVAKGTLTQVDIHPREVFRELIRTGAAHAIAIHNHPSGDPCPSTQDTAICQRLAKVGELTGIELLDFIIVAANGSSSLRDMGLMP